MEYLNPNLSDFSPISLSEMDSVKLMDRTDTKFIFHDSKLPFILNEVQNNYRVLEINNSRISPYETLYFDSEDFDFYLRHHNQKLNRYKVRFRKYVNSNLCFFEVKFKSNKDRTLKERIRQEKMGFLLNGKAKNLIENITKLKAEHLFPKLWANYFRITFVSKQLDERLTIDFNLTFKNETSEKKINNLVIAEVKQEKISFKSPFIRFMYKHHVRSISISKYCLGVTQLFPSVKMNNFKPKLITINKIIYGHN